ncbi:MAG: hypothetical protein AMXMBFR22_20100 [Phycisphaerae bacterium]
MPPDGSRDEEYGTFGVLTVQFAAGIIEGDRGRGGVGGRVQARGQGAD